MESSSAFKLSEDRARSTDTFSGIEKPNGVEDGEFNLINVTEYSTAVN